MKSYKTPGWLAEEGAAPVEEAAPEHHFHREEGQLRPPLIVVESGPALSEEGQLVAAEREAKEYRRPVTSALAALRSVVALRRLD